MRFDKISLIIIQTKNYEFNELDQYFYELILNNIKTYDILLNGGIL